MKFKGLLLDIDNTIYAYKPAHEHALNQVLSFCNENFGLHNATVLEAYQLARKKVHLELDTTAASHNRLLYFQKMLEALAVNSLDHSLKLYEMYWDHFLEKMTPFDGIYEVVEHYKNKICLVTDLTADIQHRKIHHLGLSKYASKLVTSEEAGKEKPHPYIFMLALQKLNLKADEVCMIGDNFKKDIVGASNLGIPSIWLNTDKQEVYDPSLVTEVANVKEIIALL